VDPFKIFKNSQISGGPNAEIHTPHFDATVTWTDYLGTVLVIVAIAFFITVIVALIRGINPLKIFPYMTGILSAGLKSGGKDSRGKKKKVARRPQV
jgi:hypothetical protein